MNAAIVECGAKPSGENMSKVNLIAVFKIMNQTPDDSATRVGGNGCFKMKFLMSAIAAGKRAIDRPAERLGTFRAEGLTDSRSARLAGFTDVTTWVESCR